MRGARARERLSGSAQAHGRAGGLADGPPCGRGGLCPGWTVSSSSVLLARRKRRRTARHPACVHAPAGLAPVPSPREAGNDAGGLPAGIWGLVLGEGARWGTLRSVTGTRRLHSLCLRNCSKLAPLSPRSVAGPSPRPALL